MTDPAPDSTETRGLLAQAQGGDRQAFERLFARHRPYLQQIVEIRLDARIRARVDPSDVVQETQLEAYRRLPDYLARRPMPFRLWLRKTAQDRLGVVRRQHVEAGRRAVGREVPLPEQSSLLLARPFMGDASTPSQRADRHDLARRVRRALAQLAEGDQEILLMRTYEGLSNQEIGYILGIEPGTASKRYGRAVLRLHKLLGDVGLTES